MPHKSGTELGSVGLSACTLGDWLLSLTCFTDSGVSERHQNLSSWMDYGFISYSTLYVFRKDCGTGLCVVAPEVPVLSLSRKCFAFDMVFSWTAWQVLTPPGWW